MRSYQKLAEIPLEPRQKEALEAAIVKEAKRTLIGRRFINLFGPLGAGVESVSFDTYREDALGEIHLEGKSDPDPIGAHTSEIYRRIPLVFKDFLLHWRDIEWSRDMKAPLDPANAVLAAHAVAHREDDLVFNGCKEMGITGLLQADGLIEVKVPAWTKPGAAFHGLVSGIAALQKQNHHAPFALTLSMDLYSTLLENARQSAVMETDQLAKFCEDGVFYTHVLPERTAVLVSTGPQNFDLAVAEDLSLAYLGPKDMNHLFRVYESVVLRVKRPSAICVLKVAASKG